MAKTEHYDRWRDDFAARCDDWASSTSATARPTISAHRGPGRYDWSFADETFRALQRPDSHAHRRPLSFRRPRLDRRLPEPRLAGALSPTMRSAFAQRFPWVRFYTPVNEIFIAATFSAQYGWWNERLTSDRAFVTALKHLCKANVLAMHAILRCSQARSSSRANPRSTFTRTSRLRGARATYITRSGSFRSI